MVTMMISNVGLRGKYHLVFLLDFFSLSFSFSHFPVFFISYFHFPWIIWLDAHWFLYLLQMILFIGVIFNRKIDLHEIRVVIKELSNSKSFFLQFLELFFFSLTNPSKKQIKLFFRARATLRNKRRHACNGTWDRQRTIDTRCKSEGSRSIAASITEITA